MISLSTGLPGAGKTLYTIAFVKDLAERESRPVFYSGINDLALPWHEINPEKWMDCPDGAIIVIDECQRLFRPSGSGAKVPDYVAGLETHRHKGFDIFLITQHPMLMNANVRRLTERHWHISRRFGMQRATIFQFESCKDQPLANTSQARRMEWKYPKEVFSYYKSAEVHTVKRRIPIQYAVMFLAPLLVIGIGWMFVQRHYQGGQVTITGKPVDVPQVPATNQPGQQSNVSQTSKTVDKDKPMTPEEYIQDYQPRIPGLAYTAPVYDEVTRPVEAPVPVACIDSKSQGCKCYSQQGTRLEMESGLCKQIVNKGFFIAFELKSVQEAERKAEAMSQARVQKAQQAAAQQSEPFVHVIGEGAGIPVVQTAPVPAGNDSTNPRYNVALRGK